MKIWEQLKKKNVNSGLKIRIKLMFFLFYAGQWSLCRALMLVPTPTKL